MPHKPTEVKVRGVTYEIGPHLVRQLNSENDSDGVRDLQWETSGSGLPQSYFIAACPFGGPIALARKEDDDDAKAIDNFITLYTSTGNPLPPPHVNQNGGGGGGAYVKPVEITDIGRQFNEDQSPATIFYMCWDTTNDNLLVCLTNGMVYAYKSTGEPATMAGPLLVSGAFMFTTVEKGVACITRRNTAAVIKYSADKYAYTFQEVDVPIGPMDEIVSFGGIPGSRFDSSKVAFELIIATASPDINTPCDLYSANFFHYERPQCWKIDTSKVPNFPTGNIISFAIAPTKPRMAFVMEWEEGKDNVYACSTDFQYLYRIGNTQTEVIPSQLFWVGDDIVGYVLLSSQFDEDADFSTSIVAMPYPGDQHSDDIPHNDEESTITEVEIEHLPKDAYIVVDTDCARILSTDTFQILQIVPESIRYTFPSPDAVGCNTPASILVSAYDEYASESTACVDFISEITQKAAELGEAIDQLVELAGFELDVDVQKRLLRVANFGKSFSNTYVTDNFVNMCRRLKVLQYLRSVGTLITMEQLAVIEGYRLTKRLAAHGHYQMGFEVAEILGTSPTPLLTSWAQHLLDCIPSVGITGAGPDRAKYFNIIEDMIVGKFDGCRNRMGCDMPYEMVARHAYQLGASNGDKYYTEIALRLLAATPSAKSRFGVLMEWRQAKEALRVAVESCDTDMIFEVVLELIGDAENGSGAGGSTALNAAIDTLFAYPESAAILHRYIRARMVADTISESLNQAYKDRYRAMTMAAQGNFLQPESDIILGFYLNTHEQARKLTARENAFSSLVGNQERVTKNAASEVERLFRGDRNGSQNLKVLNYHTNLLDRQVDLSKSLGDTRFKYASLAETLKLCYQHSRESDAKSIATEYNVNEKMHMWARLRGYVDAKNFADIERLSTSRKSPIGYEPFVTLLLEANEPSQAAKYIPKIQPIEKRMELYVVCGDWRGACEDCIRNREEGMLHQLRSRAKTDAAINIIDAAIQKAGR